MVSHLLCYEVVVINTGFFTYVELVLAGNLQPDELPEIPVALGFATTAGEERSTTFTTSSTGTVHTWYPLVYLTTRVFVLTTVSKEGTGTIA